MSAAAPLIRIPVGIVVERRKANSPWADLVWRPVAVLPGLPDAIPWTPLDQDGDAVTYYAGPGEIAAVTADPAEGEALTKPGQAIVEAVAMPEPVCDAIARFIAQYPAAPPFTKRKRDRADPEILARRASPLRKDHERR